MIGGHVVVNRDRHMGYKLVVTQFIKFTCCFVDYVNRVTAIPLEAYSVYITTELLYTIKYSVIHAIHVY